MNSKTQSNYWFNGLDSLRYILCLVVLFSHIFSHPEFRIPPNYPTISLLSRGLNLVFNGTAFVIAFFILSGFLIHYTSKSETINLKKFYARRFIRLLGPLLIVYLIESRLEYIDKSIFWSIICELVYYFIYPFIVKINLTWKMKFLISFIFSLVLIVIFAFNDILALFNQSSSYYHRYYWQLGPLFTWVIGLPCWLLGVLIPENIDNEKQLVSKKIYLIRAFILILSIGLNLLKKEHFLSNIISMIFFVLICYFWIKNEIIYYKSKKPFYFMEKLGKSSYSLFICHPLIILVSIHYFPVNLPTAVFVTGLAIILSYIFYILIEKPFHTLARNIGNSIIIPNEK